MNSVFTFPFIFPSETNRVVLFGRHSKAYSNGPNHANCLTHDGIKLCQNVSPYYLQLVAALVGRFDFNGSAVYVGSNFLRSPQTIEEVFHPEYILRHSMLNNTASLKDVDGGEWFKERQEKNLSIPVIVKEALATEAILSLPIFQEGIRNYHDFIVKTSFEMTNKAKVVVSFAHEITISANAQLYIVEGKDGLLEMEAYLFCLNTKNSIVEVRKVTPLA